MGKIFLFGPVDVMAVKSIAGPLRLGVKAVDGVEYNQTLGFLAGIDKRPAAPYEGDLPEESLLLFYQVEDPLVDKMLKGIRKKGLDITYKAIMTPTNRQWTVRRLYVEMERERRSFVYGKG